MKSPRSWNLLNKGHANNTGFTVSLLPSVQSKQTFWNIYWILLIFNSQHHNLVSWINAYPLQKIWSGALAKIMHISLFQRLYIKKTSLKSVNSFVISANSQSTKFSRSRIGIYNPHHSEKLISFSFFHGHLTSKKISTRSVHNFWVDKHITACKHHTTSSTLFW